MVAGLKREKGLSLCILSQDLTLTYKGLSDPETTKDHHDPERRLLQRHSTDGRWFLSAKLRRISSWKNWRKVALFKQASVGLIYNTLRMLGYMGLTLLLSLQNTHLQNPSNQQWFPDIVQNINTSPVRYSWHALAELLMILHFLTGNHNSKKKRLKLTTSIRSFWEK